MCNSLSFPNNYINTNNVKWVELIKNFLEKYFSKYNISIEVVEDKEEHGVYIKTFYGDISETILTFFREELHIYHYSYNTRFGIDAIHIRDLPDKIFLNGEFEMKCLHGFIKSFIKVREKAEDLYKKNFKNYKGHILYKYHLWNKKMIEIPKYIREIMFSYLLCGIETTFDKYSNSKLDMYEYETKYNMLISYLSEDKTNFDKVYRNRKKIISLEGYFEKFWANNLLIY